MSVVLDTSVVVALYETKSPDQASAAGWLNALDDELVTTPLAVAEMDYLVRRRGGTTGQKALWRNLDAGAITVRWWADALDETLKIVRRRPDLGLVDGSLVALADRLRTDRIATFDHRHFRTLRTRGGKRFTILPDDA